MSDGNDPLELGEPAIPENKNQQQDQQQQQAVSISMDDSNVSALYTNMCRVSCTPEEVILDLAMNPEPVNSSNLQLKVSQRVIMNHYTAKRMVALLASAIRQHEAIFGPLETDIRKRVKNPPKE